MTDDDLTRALSGLARPSVPDDLRDRIAGDAALERAFLAARARAPVPSDLLMARIARDARFHRRTPWFDAAAWGGPAAAAILGLTIGMTGTLSLWPDAAAASVADAALTVAYEFETLGEE